MEVVQKCQCCQLCVLRENSNFLMAFAKYMYTCCIINLAFGENQPVIEVGIISPREIRYGHKVFTSCQNKLHRYITHISDFILKIYISF